MCPQSGIGRGKIVQMKDIYSPTWKKWASAEKKLLAHDPVLYVMKRIDLIWGHNAILAEVHMICRANTPLCQAGLTDCSWILQFCPHSLASSDPPIDYHLLGPAWRKRHMHFRTGSVYLTVFFNRHCHHFLRCGIWGIAVQWLLCWWSRTFIKHS